MNRPQRPMLQHPRIQRRISPGVERNRLDRFSTSLDTFQQVLGVIQSTTPYIEKYGPVVQKLPTIYRMYRAMKNIDDPVSVDDSDKESVPTHDDEPPIKSVERIGSYPLPTLFI